MAGRAGGNDCPGRRGVWGEGYCGGKRIQCGVSKVSRPFEAHPSCAEVPEVMSERAIYTERTPWPGWVQIMLWGTVSLATLTTLLGLGGSDSEPGHAVAILALGGGVHWLLGGLTLRLYRDHLVVGLGSATIIRSSISYDQVKTVEAVRYSPLREFGGWGYRIRGHRRAWTARGNDAVVLFLDGGREVYLGTDTPDRLRGRILAIAGGRVRRVGRDGGPGPSGPGTPP